MDFAKIVKQRAVQLFGFSHAKKQKKSGLLWRRRVTSMLNDVWSQAKWVLSLRSSDKDDFEGGERNK